MAWARPWRSAALGWLVAGLALVGGVPLFLCMPPWVDVTLYDVAARNVLRGGVHYRDVFDTNLPGMVWATAAVRVAFGWSFEALRACDLLVLVSTTVVVGAVVRRTGASHAAVAWFAAAVALFYPFTSEFSHCQRDPWMLLPVAAATYLRLNWLSRATRGDVGSVGGSLLEGFVWGLAVWLKPHALVPAAAVWLVSAVRLARLGSPRRVATDFVGLVCGGLLAGGPGVAWLCASGAWPDFWDVFTRWNPEYLREGVWDDLPARAEREFWYFAPWSLLHLAALPLAVRDVYAAVGRSRPLDPARAVLAALYLGWFAQALLLQKGFDYVHVPETLLAMAVLAGRGWAVGFPFFLWFAAVGIGLAVADGFPGSNAVVDSANSTTHLIRLERHPLTDPNALALWTRCWREGSTPELRDRLAQHADIHCSTKWEDLEAVARYLRTVRPKVGDRELTCWHDSTHPLYLMLDVDPSTRYMHYGTVFPLRGKVAEVRRAVAESPQRFVVSDLLRMTYRVEEAYAPGAASPLSLPAWLPKSQRGLFPWNQPVAFRAGRYVVHRVTRTPSPAEIDIPDWYTLDELGPGE